MLRRFSMVSALFLFGGCLPADSQPLVPSTQPTIRTGNTGQKGTDLTRPAVTEGEKETTGAFEEVDHPEDAELILVVEVSFPRVAGKSPHRFWLRRKKADATASNETKLPSGYAGDGADGGSGGSIGLTGLIPTDGKVLVYASISWRFQDASEGKFEKEIAVPWKGELTQEVGSGASVHCYFEKPKPASKQ